jgi:hypothetical protein
VAEVRRGFPSLTDVQVGLMASAALHGSALDPHDADDACVLLRAEALVEKGTSASHALAQARAEVAATRRPSRDSAGPHSASESEPTLEEALNDPDLFAHFVAPYGVIVDANGDAQEDAGVRVPPRSVLDGSIDGHPRQPPQTTDYSEGGPEQ